MTKEEKMARFKKKLERIWEIRKMKSPEDDKKITPPRYDDVYWEGVEWLNKNG